LAKGGGGWIALYPDKQALRTPHGRRQQGPAATASGSAQGSFATLMDQIFGRGTPEQQLDEMKRANTLATETSRSLNEILKKMDEEPPRDMWTGA
jgi:hypothetical protein